MSKAVQWIVHFATLLRLRCSVQGHIVKCTGPWNLSSRKAAEWKKNLLLIKYSNSNVKTENLSQKNPMSNCWCQNVKLLWRNFPKEEYCRFLSFIIILRSSSNISRGHHHHPHPMNGIWKGQEDKWIWRSTEGLLLAKSNQFFLLTSSSSPSTSSLVLYHLLWTIFSAVSFLSSLSWSVFIWKHAHCCVGTVIQVVFPCCSDFFPGWFVDLFGRQNR